MPKTSTNRCGTHNLVHIFLVMLFAFKCENAWLGVKVLECRTVDSIQSTLHRTAAHHRKGFNSLLRVKRSTLGVGHVTPFSPCETHSLWQMSYNKAFNVTRDDGTRVQYGGTAPLTKGGQRGHKCPYTPVS